MSQRGLFGFACYNLAVVRVVVKFEKSLPCCVVRVNHSDVMTCLSECGGRAWPALNQYFRQDLVGKSYKTGLDDQGQSNDTEDCLPVSTVID